jgi:toxin ParE1/3/4
VSLPLLIREPAQADLQEAFTWYEGKQKGLGREFIQAVEASFSRIESNPLQFPVLRGETRRAIIARFPYGVFYVPGKDAISVMAVMHHARAPTRWQQRS